MRFSFALLIGARLGSGRAESPARRQGETTSEGETHEKQFLALLSGALVLALSVGVGLSIAAGPPAGATSLGEPVAVGTSRQPREPSRERERSARRASRRSSSCSRARSRRARRSPRSARGGTSQLAPEDTDKIFVVLVEFGNKRYPNSRIPDKTPAGAPASDAQRFDGPLHNEIPQPDRKVDNSTLWQADYNKAHYDDMYFNRMAEYYESPVVRSVLGRRVTSPSGSRCRSTRRSTAATPAAASSARTSWSLDPRRAWRSGSRTSSTPARRCRRSRLPPHVRRVGPVRRRRRRELRRAGRVHRPLPDRPRRRRRGRGRPAPGHGRDLEPPLATPAARPAARAASPASTSAPNASGVAVGSRRARPEQPDGRLGRRLHDPARERRPRRLRPRVRPRPRPAGPLRHVRQHRRRRELDRRSGRSCPRARTSATVVPTGSATTRPTSAPGRSSSSAGSTARRRRRPVQALCRSGSAQLEPGRRGNASRTGLVRRPAGQAGRPPRSARRDERRHVLLVAAAGRRPRQHDDEVDHAAGGRRDLRRRPVRHRGATATTRSSRSRRQRRPTGRRSTTSLSLPGRTTRGGSTSSGTRHLGHDAAAPGCRS